MEAYMGGWVVGAAVGLVVGLLAAWNWVEQPEAVRKALVKLKLVKE